MIDERDPAFRRATAKYAEIVLAHRESVERIQADADKRAAESAALKEQDARKRDQLLAELKSKKEQVEAQKAASGENAAKKTWADRPAPDDSENYEFLQFDEATATPPPPEPPPAQTWTPPPSAPPPPPPPPAPAPTAAPAPRRRAAAADEDEDFAEHKWWAG